MTPASTAIVQSIVDLLSEAAEKLEIAGFHYALLFGSVVRGEAHRFSDVDVAIGAAEHLSLRELGRLVDRFESAVEKRIDLVQTNNLYKTKPRLAFEIARDGLPLRIADEESLVDFKKNAYIWYLDTQHLRTTVDDALRKRLTSGNAGRRNYVDET